MCMLWPLCSLARACKLLLSKTQCICRRKYSVIFIPSGPAALWLQQQPGVLSRDSAKCQCSLGRHNDSLRLHMFINLSLAATSHETLHRTHFPMVSQTCQRSQIRAGGPFSSPCPSSCLQEEGKVVCLLTAHGYHHKDQLQPQDSPYLAPIKSENAAAQVAHKKQQRLFHMDFLRKQKKPPLVLPVSSLTLVPGSESHHTVSRYCGHCRDSFPTESHFCVLRAKGGKAAFLTSIKLREASSPDPFAFRSTFAFLLVACDEALNQLQFFMFFLQEEVNEHTLLLFNLFTDVLGDVRNHPVHQNTEEHHQVLQTQQQRWSKYKKTKIPALQQTQIFADGV